MALDLNLTNEQLITDMIAYVKHVDKYSTEEWSTKKEIAKEEYVASILRAYTT